MNRRLVSVVLFGVMIAGVASAVLYRLMMRRASMDAAPAVATSQIAIATADLELGTLVKDSDFKMAPWPTPLPAGVISQKSDLLGRCIAASIYAGEPIAAARLAPAGSGGGLAATIPEGMRAVAVRVNEVVGVAGFVVTGTHVDVLASGTYHVKGDSAGDTVTRTILQDLTVLSAGQDYKQNADGKPATVQVVNLLVTPQQAETLSLAGSQTTIQLVLRNPLDKQIVATVGTTLAAILGGVPVLPAHLPAPTAHRVPFQPAPAVVTPPVAAEPFAMEIITGNKRMGIGPQAPGTTR